MTNVDRRKIVPFPGIMNLASTSGEIWISASSITDISRVVVSEQIFVFQDLEPGKLYCVVNATGFESSIFIEIAEEQQAFEYVKIWATERLIK